jgi:hypothetical protein
MALLDSASPAGGLPAWATLVAPSSAPMAAAVPLMSLALFPLDLALAQESQASSLKSQPPNTGLGSRVKLDFKEAKLRNSHFGTCIYKFVVFIECCHM